MTPDAPDPFFVGYVRTVAPRIRTFALCAGAGMIGLFALAGFLVPLGTIDPGSGRYADDLRGGVLTGVIEHLPYSILRVPATEGSPARAVLLGGQTKVGAQDRVALGTPAIDVAGVFVRRGDFDMLLISGNGAKASAAPMPDFQPAPAEDLGRWRLTGEICDGKCYGGAMKPGRGLAHKACANLCITEGLPPVLVMELPVAGSTTLLLAAGDGGPMPAFLLHLTAIPIQLEGQLERRDDLLIFRVDESSFRRM